MHVVRQRKRATGLRSGLLERRRLRLVLAGTSALAVIGSGAAFGTTEMFADHQVGQQYANGLQISSNQVLAPLGDRLSTPYGKFMGTTVSPDGRYLTATANDRSISLQVFDLRTYQLIQRAGSASDADLKLTDNTVGQEGPVYSPDGSHLYVPNATGITKLAVGPDGTLSNPTKIGLPTVGTKQALVGGMTSSPDGTVLYAALNGQNTVVAIDTASGQVTKTWNVGIAPRQVQLVDGKLYVTDEGGRQARDGEPTQDSYGTAVPADPNLGTSTTGTLSVVDPTGAAPVGTVEVGLHPTSMYARGGVLYVANTNDDTVSVVDTARDRTVQTISTQPWRGSDVGYEPTGMVVQGNHLLVTLGRANAVAVYKLGKDALDPVSYVGLLPTDYYPEDVFSVGGRTVVANRRGIDARGQQITSKQGYGTTPATAYGTHGTTASLTRFTLPDDREIRARWTKQVFAQNGWTDDAANERVKGRRNVPAVPVPRRLGDPSTIKHVFLVVKENRTYDQVYGDLPQGDGDKSLAQFGEQTTPNQHALARQFGLYDNTYDVGTNSAEGHNWLMQGDDPEYTESSAGEYTRSYDTEEDVLGHQRSGFLWTAAQGAGASARNFGEFLYAEGKPAGTWQQYYCAARSVQEGGDPAQLTTPDLKGNYGSVIPSLDAITNPTSPPFDLSIPDVYREQVWKQDFQQDGPKNFQMLWLSSDHTGGPSTPRAAVADGDLAVGRVVDTISHSKWWKSSAIFVVEDDSQAGVDHVDGHRAPVQVISPYAVHGRTVSTYYSQISMIRTIEQILGAEPLNQKVAAASPMFDAFTSRADVRPFTAVPNRIPLTENVNPAPACGPDTPAGAPPAPVVPPAQKPLADAWGRWAQEQHFTGRQARADYAHPEQMNRYTWYQAHDWRTPYPGDSRLFTPDQVPGGAIPAPEGD